MFRSTSMCLHVEQSSEISALIMRAYTMLEHLLHGGTLVVGVQATGKTVSDPLSMS